MGAASSTPPAARSSRASATAAHGSLNSVFMIAFEDEAPLEALVRGIQAANQEIRRPSDRVRLFQVPLDRIV